MLKNNNSEYGLFSIIIHWLMALLIIFVFSLGISFDFFERGDPGNRLVHFLHFGFGFFIFAFLIVRLTWFRISPKPEPIKTQKKFEIKLSKIVHNLLYTVIFILPVTGYLRITADGDDFNVLNIFKIPSLFQTENESLLNVIDESHEIAAYVLAVLVILHLLGVIKHHFCDKDRTLLRMIGKK